jgi:hypothetical protein
MKMYLFTEQEDITIKKMKRKLRDEYRERAKVETVHSVIKRRFGDFLRSMDKINSKKEEIMKFLVYNITRMIKITKNYEKLIFLKGFLLSFPLKKLIRK